MEYVLKVERILIYGVGMLYILNHKLQLLHVVEVYMSSLSHELTKLLVLDFHHVTMFARFVYIYFRIMILSWNKSGWMIKLKSYLLVVNVYQLYVNH